MSNDFKAFAVGVGSAANLALQAAYEASAELGAGFISGIVSRLIWNKAMRQSSMVSHVLAQLISDTLGENVVDDGNATTLQDQLARAIKSLANADIRFAADSFAWPAAPGAVGALAHTPNSIMVPVVLLDGVEQPQDGSVYTITGTAVAAVASNPPFGAILKVRYAYTP